MKAIQTPFEEVTYLGEQGFGWCPECYSNVLSLGETHWDGDGFVIK